jgi:hypothetical protein
VTTKSDLPNPLNLSQESHPGPGIRDRIMSVIN